MIKDRLNSVRGRIRRAAERAGRNPSDIILVCVTKEATIQEVNEAMEAGVTDIGENRVQDSAAKYNLVRKDLAIRWHFIGHLQTNKVKKAVELFDLIHSVDSVRLAETIQRNAEGISKMQSILVQVNISGEETKYGVDSESLANLTREIRDMKNLMLLGLMTIAPYSADAEDSRKYFRRLRELRDSLLSYNCDNVDLKHLSMGMSQDFEVAIEEGANIVRIGSAIFK